MTYTERLIEVATYASENNMRWWEAFDSKAEALAVVTKVLRESPDENEIICLMNAIDPEDSFEYCTIEKAYKEMLKSMKKELEESED